MKLHFLRVCIFINPGEMSCAEVVGISHQADTTGSEKRAHVDGYFPVELELDIGGSFLSRGFSV